MSTHVTNFTLSCILVHHDTDINAALQSAVQHWLYVGFTYACVHTHQKWHDLHAEIYKMKSTYWHGLLFTLAQGHWEFPFYKFTFSEQH